MYVTAYHFVTETLITYEGILIAITAQHDLVRFVCRHTYAQAVTLCRFLPYCPYMFKIAHLRAPNAHQSMFVESNRVIWKQELTTEQDAVP